MTTLVSDIDGTIYINKTITKKDIGSINKFTKDNKLIFATGRNFQTFTNLIKKYPLPYSYCLLCNGAIIIDSHNKIIRELTFSSKIIKDIYADLMRANIEVGLSFSYAKEGVYFPNIRHINIDLLEKKPNELSGICVELNSEDNALSHIFKRLREKYDISIQQNGKYIDIVPKNATKARAINFLILKRLVNTQLAVLGDSTNDITLFGTFTQSFVINTSPPTVKKFARYEVNNISECISILEKLYEK